MLGCKSTRRDNEHYPDIDAVMQGIMDELSDAQGMSYSEWRGNLESAAKGTLDDFVNRFADNYDLLAGKVRRLAKQVASELIHDYDVLGDPTPFD